MGKTSFRIIRLRRDDRFRVWELRTAISLPTRSQAVQGEDSSSTRQRTTCEDFHILRDIFRDGSLRILTDEFLRLT
jgi:hypothetical protein